MNRPGLLAYAANFAPALFRLRRTTWAAIGAGLVVLAALLIWAALALLGWFFGMTQNAPETVRRGLRQVEDVAPGARDKLAAIASPLAPMARGVLDRMDEIIPGARDKWSEMAPTLKPPPQPQREVSGRDLGPVARYPGLVRTQWSSSGAGAAVEYEGKAIYAAVLDHYLNGFAAQGYKQAVQSATGSGETHEFAKGPDRLILKVAQKPAGVVGVRLETKLR